jgi:hypothetical protein
LTPDNKNYWIDPDRTCTKYGDKSSEKDALARWNHAKRSVGEVNNAEMPYSFCGVGKSLGFFKCKNSNSTYSTMGDILGVKTHYFKGYFSPGSKTMMLPQKAITAIAYLRTEESVREEQTET